MSEHGCIVLAIDPARTSGWASMAPTGPVRSGTATAIGDLASAVGLAQGHASGANLPLVVVGESWKGGLGRMGLAQATGMGAAWGRWLAVLEMAGHPKRRTLRLDTGTWRKRAYGTSRKRSAQWKAMAKAYVERRWGVALSSDDEAEALVLGHIAIRSPEVAAVLPRRKG